ncbi:MAG TPA: molybdenum cofactor guanylyltransferase [Thiotrichales bacterium]|nr:molybdenum cofactor guanylyltransferase [Thiotrichales bacterium]
MPDRSIPSPVTTTAIVLAGGAGRRMGGREKGLLPFAGRPLVTHVIETLSRQAAEVIVSANRHLEAYRRFGHPVVRDTLEGLQGPLAGILAAGESASHPWLLVAPCDVPGLPDDLLERLARGILRQDARLAAAHDGNRLHPTVLLLHRPLLDEIRHDLERGDRQVIRFLRRHGCAEVDFGDRADALANINTPEELARLERRWKNEP